MNMDKHGFKKAVTRISPIIANAELTRKLESWRQGCRQVQLRFLVSMRVQSRNLRHGFSEADLSLPSRGRAALPSRTLFSLATAAQSQAVAGRWCAAALIRHFDYVAAVVECVRTVPAGENHARRVKFYPGGRPGAVSDRLFSRKDACR
jgi:hypothetical protein